MASKTIPTFLVIRGIVSVLEMMKTTRGFDM